MDISHINSVNFKVALEFAESLVSGRKIANDEQVQACQRFLNDLKRDDLDFKQEQFDFVIGFIEGTIHHVQGEDKEGN